MRAPSERPPSRIRTRDVDAEDLPSLLDALVDQGVLLPTVLITPRQLQHEQRTPRLLVVRYSVFWRAPTEESPR